MGSNEFGFENKIHLLAESFEGGGGVGRRTAVVTQHDLVGVGTDEGNFLVGADGQQRSGIALGSFLVLHQHDTLLGCLQCQGLVGFTLQSVVYGIDIVVELSQGKAGFQDTDDSLVDIFLGEGDILQTVGCSLLLGLELRSCGIDGSTLQYR